MKKIFQSISTLWQKAFAGSRSPSQIFLGLKGEDVLGVTKNTNGSRNLSVSLYVGHSKIIEGIDLPITSEFLGVLKQFPTLLESKNSGITRKPKPTTNEQISNKQVDGSSTSSSKLAKRLDNALNELLKHDEFMEVRDEIRDRLDSSNLLQNDSRPEIYIQYDDPDIAQIPLHRWKVLDSLEVEPVFSKFNVKPCDHSYTNRKKPRILIILGNAYNHGEDNLDLQADIELWKDNSLPNVEIIPITPLNYGDIGSQLWDQDWDILYFAGHSDTENGDTLIELNNEFKISFSQLQESIQTAVKNGLKLAIFNSCISLGAAADLHKAGVPAVVAMRYEIPDVVAHTFLKFFLQEHLNRGRSVSASVKQVRKRLYEIEKQGGETYKFASWLPVVFQIPSTAISAKTSILSVIATSFFVTCLVFFLHTQGIFQGAELSLYDHMMNSRLAESLNPNIILVKPTLNDQIWQKEQGEKLQGDESIGDKHLWKLLEKLDKAKPKVIGMALWRGYSASEDPQSKEKIDKRLASTQLPILVSNCATKTINEPDRLPPKSVKPGHPHIGFTNFPIDRNFGNTLRRLELIKLEKDSICSEFTVFSFPFQIVIDYLGISFQEIQDKFQNLDGVSIETRGVYLSNVMLKQGGYQISPSSEELSNRLSILFNYKNHEGYIPDTGNNKQIFSLKEIISTDQESLNEIVHDKIVVIGGVGEESFNFPSSKSNIKSIENSYIHLQAIDYLLRVFDTKGTKILNILKNNTFLFLYSFFYISITSIILQEVINRFKKYQFIFLSLAISLSILIVFYVHLIILEKLLLWVPSIPIFWGVILSSFILSLSKIENIKYSKNIW